MRICHLKHLFCLAWLLAIVPGCLVLHPCRPEPIEVRDAETNKPIAGANVRISYPLEDALFAPPEAGFTGPDGIARLKAAPFGRAGVMVDVTAKGYMNEQKVLSIEEVQALEPARWFEDVNKRPASLVMQMYADPHATVELVVPPGFHGQLKIKIDVASESKNATGEPAAPRPKFEPGQRMFSFAVPPAGVGEAIGPPIFRHVTPGNLRVRFADDFPISRHAQDTSVGYWWLKCEQKWHYLLVGTQSEYDSFCPAVHEKDAGDKRSSGGGQGRHGRKGSQLPMGDTP